MKKFNVVSRNFPPVRYVGAIRSIYERLMANLVFLSFEKKPYPSNEFKFWLEARLKSLQNYHKKKRELGRSFYEDFFHLF